MTCWSDTSGQGVERMSKYRIRIDMVMSSRARLAVERNREYQTGENRKERQRVRYGYEVEESRIKRGWKMKAVLDRGNLG